MTHSPTKPITLGFSLSLVLHGLAFLALFLFLKNPSAPSLVTIDLLRDIRVASPQTSPPKKHPSLPTVKSQPSSLPSKAVTPSTTPVAAAPTVAATESSGAASNVSSNAEGATTYLGELRARIESLKQYPALSRNRGQTGKAEIGFTILKSGEITNVHFVSESPFEPLNKAALAAVMGVRKFKPIPDELARNEWSLVIPIIFKMD